MEGDYVIFPDGRMVMEDKLTKTIIKKYLTVSRFRSIIEADVKAHARTKKEVAEYLREFDGSWAAWRDDAVEYMAGDISELSIWMPELEYGTIGC